MTIPVLDIMGVALVFIRIGGIYFALPIIGDSPTPLRTRILLTVGTTLCITPLLPPEWTSTIDLSLLGLILAVLKELLIGIVLGFTARMAFDGLIMAASVVGYQMGFGTANLLVPDAGMQMDGFTAFHRILMILIFFAMDMHHTYLFAIGDTFKFIPIGTASYSPDFAIFFTKITAGVFSTALQLASPVLVALMFTMSALGLIARTVPQMNVFTLSFPVSFGIGLLVYMATLPFMPGWLNNHYLDVHQNLRDAIIGLR